MSILRNYDIYSIEERLHNLESGGSPTPGGGSWDYSTEETDTHQKWTDGKTIYCRVISGTFNFRANASIQIMARGDIDSIIDFRAYAHDSETSGVISPQLYVMDNNLMGHHFAPFNATSVIIYYTKTELAKTKRSKK